MLPCPPMWTALLLALACSGAPDPERLDLPPPADAPFGLAIIATIAVGIPAWIVWRDTGLHAEPAQLFLGTLPNLLLFALAAVLQASAWNSRWRDAASVRLALRRCTPNPPPIVVVKTPVTSTITSSTTRSVNGTSCPERTVAVSWGGPTTTAADWVRFDSRRLVSSQICPSSPWARFEKARTRLVVAEPRGAGRLDSDHIQQTDIHDSD